MLTTKEYKVENARNIVDYLTHSDTKDWRKLLQLRQTWDLMEQRNFLWVWPTEEELQKLSDLLKRLSIDRLLSIGCGNGLLEWILRESIGVTVYGLEADRSWWKSKYAVRSFIELSYIDDMPAINCEDYLQSCCHTTDWNFALLFCYFNNRAAFNNYLQMYKGNWLILIGPRIDVEIYTEPLPLEPHFPATAQWQLQQVLNLGANDVVAFYTNITGIEKFV